MTQGEVAVLFIGACLAGPLVFLLLIWRDSKK